MRKSLVICSVALAMITVGCGGPGAPTNSGSSAAEISQNGVDTSSRTSAVEPSGDAAALSSNPTRDSSADSASNSPVSVPGDSDVSVRSLREFLETLTDDTPIDKCPLGTIAIVEEVERSGDFDFWTSDERPYLELRDGSMGSFSWSDGVAGMRIICPYLTEIPGQAGGSFNDPQLEINSLLVTAGVTDFQAQITESIVSNGGEAPEWSAFGGGSLSSAKSRETADGVDYNRCSFAWVKQSVVVFVSFARVVPYDECGTEAQELFRDQLPRIVSVGS